MKLSLLFVISCVIIPSINAWDAGPVQCAHSACSGGAVTRAHGHKWTGNTHLYIVQQALKTLKNSNIAVYQKIEQAMNSKPCKQLWENGLWDQDGPGLADSDQKGSHFWNPAKVDWNGDKTTTSTWKDVFYDHTSFGNAHSNMMGYLRYPPERHCYTLGRALHFITDATMPFHTASMSAINGVSMLHPYFEESIPVIQASTTAASVKWPTDNYAPRTLDIWLGEAPACAASSDDCTKHNMQFIKSDSKGDGSTCVTGHKVLCRLTAPAWPQSGSGAWDRLTPSEMLKVMALRSNKYAAALTRVINAAGGTCTYSGLGLLYTGDCFYAAASVKPIVSFLLRDAFLATANMLYAIFNNMPTQPVAVRQWFGTAPSCAADSTDCKQWGGVQISTGNCGDGDCCVTGHKVHCEKLPGNFQDQIWVGTAPACAASAQDCKDRNMVWVKNHNSGDGSPCVTGHKVLCRYKWKSTDEGASAPAPVFDTRHVQRWFGTAPFCGADKSDCTGWGGTWVKNSDCGDGSCCSTGHKVLCTKTLLVPTLLELDDNEQLDNTQHQQQHHKNQIDTQEDTDAYHAY